MSGGLWSRIKRVALTDVSVLVKGLDTHMLESLERVLIEADFGPAALDLVEELESLVRRGALKTEAQVHDWLEDRLTAMASQSSPPDGEPLLAGKPAAVILLGVNGAGKTTQAAKLARRYMNQGKTVLLAAADTYRAAAREQLAVWAERLDLQLVSGDMGTDPAAVVFDAISAARARGIDVVIVDTGGRLHTNEGLMAELAKVCRVAGRKAEASESLLVLDGTVGQNALHQGRAFLNSVPVAGLIVTKLDGTAKGGAVLQMSRQLDVPIRFIGVGEQLDDLVDFSPREFARRVLDG